MIDINCHVLLVHITKVEGRPVDWYGWFGGFGDGLAEGFAWKAELQDDKPVVVEVGKYCQRLDSRNVKFDSLNHFKWSRLYDKENKLEVAPGTVSVFCIPIDSVTDDHLLNDPEYRTITRKIATFHPVLKDGKPTIEVSFEDEQILQPTPLR